MSDVSDYLWNIWRKKMERKQKHCYAANTKFIVIVRIELSTQNHNSKWSEDKNKQNVAPINDIDKMRSKTKWSAQQTHQKWYSTICMLLIFFFLLLKRSMRRLMRFNGAVKIDTKKKQKTRLQNVICIYTKTWINFTLGAAPFLSVRFVLQSVTIQSIRKKCFIQSDKQII